MTLGRVTLRRQTYARRIYRKISGESAVNLGKLFFCLLWRPIPLSMSVGSTSELFPEIPVVDQSLKCRAVIVDRIFNHKTNILIQFRNCSALSSIDDHRKSCKQWFQNGFRYLPVFRMNGENIALTQSSAKLIVRQRFVEFNPIQHIAPFGDATQIVMIPPIANDRELDTWRFTDGPNEIVRIFLLELTPDRNHSSDSAAAPRWSIRRSGAPPDAERCSPALGCCPGSRGSGGTP